MEGGGVKNLKIKWCREYGGGQRLRGPWVGHILKWNTPYWYFNFIKIEDVLIFANTGFRFLHSLKMTRNRFFSFHCTSIKVLLGTIVQMVSISTEWCYGSYCREEHEQLVLQELSGASGRDISINWFVRANWYVSLGCRQSTVNYTLSFLYQGSFIIPRLGGGLHPPEILITLPNHLICPKIF